MKSFVEKYKRQTKSPKSTVDFKELKALREKHFYKFKEGKNQFIVLWPEDMEDAIFTWGYYNNLLEQPYYSIPADNYNKGDEDCPIHKVLEELKENEEENRPIITPIDLKVDEYALIVPIDEDGEYSEMAYWRRIPYSIMKEFINHFENLEEDEPVFYDREEPSKIIVNYDPNASPAQQYSVSFKSIKKSQLPTKEQYKKWLDNIIPLADFNPSRTKAQKEEIIANYLARTAESLSQED